MGKKKRRRGHFCWCCGGMKSNEQFSGCGHRDHICKKCQKIPVEKRQKMRDEQFVWGVWNQTTISPGNIKKLDEIAAQYKGSELGRKGASLAQAGRIKPGRKKRKGTLYFNHRALFDELVKLRIIWDSITPDIEAELEWEIKGYEQYEFDAEEHAALVVAYEEHCYGKLLTKRKPLMSALQMMISAFPEDDDDDYLF